VGQVGADQRHDLIAGFAAAVIVALPLMFTTIGGDRGTPPQTAEWKIR
jgi:hypothetical protein